MGKPKVITYSFGSDLIGKVSDILYKDFYKKGKPLDRVACIFGGRRPALFLKKRLAQKIKSSFLPPSFFSMDEFMHYIVFSNQSAAKVSDLELYYLIWRLSKGKLLFFNKKSLEFPDFLSWAKEIVSFIEQLDLEGVENNSLLDIEKSASIGYEVPEGINRLLGNIVSIRKEYHQFLKSKNLWSRGLIYLEAAKKSEKKDFSEFDKIFFCNLYYLNKSESKVLKVFARGQKSVFIFEGSAGDWTVLKDNSRLLGQPIEPSGSQTTSPNINFYRGSDTQSQVSLAVGLLKEITNKDSTLILLPKPDTLVPLLSEAAEALGCFNVSLGYPLNRSSLYVLFNYLFDVYQSRKNNSYYLQDYLKVLKHPLIKNIAIGRDALLARVLAHKIEEALTGAIDSSVGGSLFVSLAAIEKDSKINAAYRATLLSLGHALDSDSYPNLTGRIHDLFFRSWEKVNSLAKFGRQLEAVLDSLSGHSLFLRFPLESKAMEFIYKIKEEFSSLSFAEHCFNLEQIWDIFKQRLDSGRISFVGSPLKGAQILGLLETRSLQFKNVLVLDANEGILPKLRVAEPLIPSEVMMNLGLGRLQKEEEVQRYNFTRLVQSAENVYLIWSQNQAQEKSRFIERLIWEKEKSGGNFNLGQIPKISFSLAFSRSMKVVQKTAEIIEYLQKCTYSASRINIYLECPLRFYYKYVLGLGEKKDLTEEVKESQIGIFIHRLLFETYAKFLGKKPVFDSEFEIHFQKLFNSRYKKEIEPRMRSDHFLLKKIIEARLIKFFDQEKKREPAISRIEALEKEYSDNFNLDGLSLEFRYVIDRIDSYPDRRLSVIDYKTGGKDNIARRLSSLEKMKLNRRQIKENIKSFQLPLYSYFIQNRFRDKDVNSYIYNLRRAEVKPFISAQDYQGKEKVLDCCLEALKFILRQIFDSKIPFEADKETRRCSYCPYSNLC